MPTPLRDHKHHGAAHSSTAARVGAQRPHEPRTPGVPLRPRRPAGRCSLSPQEKRLFGAGGGLQVSGAARERARGWGLGALRAASAHLPVRGRSAGWGRWARCRRCCCCRWAPGAAAALPGAGEPSALRRGLARLGLGRRPAPPALHAGPAPVACARTTARPAHHAGRGRPHPSLLRVVSGRRIGGVDGGRRGCDGKGSGRGWAWRRETRGRGAGMSCVLRPAGAAPPPRPPPPRDLLVPSALPSVPSDPSVPPARPPTPEGSESRLNPSRRRQIQLAALAGGSPRSSVSRVRALVTQTRGDPRPRPLLGACVLPLVRASWRPGSGGPGASSLWSCLALSVSVKYPA